MVGTVNEWEELKNDKCPDRLKNAMAFNQPNVMEFWEPEFFDLVTSMRIGADKGYDNAGNQWLQETGATMSHKDNCASMFRHLAEFTSGSHKVKDAEIHPLLAVACRAMMGYTRWKRGIKHIKD